DLRRGALAGSDLVELRKSQAVVEDVAALQPFLGGIFALGEGGDPTEIAVTNVTPNFFALLGVNPMLGRTFAANETGRGRPNLIVLTHALWNRVGADAGIVGKQVRLQGNAYTVIGVLPPTFSFVRSDAIGGSKRIDAFVAFEEDLANAKPS